MRTLTILDDVQAALSLCWLHRSHCRFCPALAQIICLTLSLPSATILGFLQTAQMQMRWLIRSGLIRIDAVLTFSLSTLHINVFPVDSLLKCSLKFGAERVKAFTLRPEQTVQSDQIALLSFSRHILDQSPHSQLTLFNLCQQRMTN